MPDSRFALTKRLVTGLVIFAISMPAALAEVAPGTPWTKPYFTRLDVSFPGGSFHARWDFHRCDCGDVLIQGEETLPKEILTGEQLLVGGRVLLQSGFDQTGPALLDSPMLMLQLLFVLLEKAAPVSPGNVEAPLNISETDESNPLLLDTGTAHGGFPAPWSVRGEVRRIEDGSHRFNLEFEFDTGGQGESEMQLTGAMDYQPRSFPQGDDMPLAGWSVHFIKSEDAEFFAERHAGTLGELREMVKQLKTQE